MVFGAKLRTIMSSIIRWRKGETLRAVAMDCSKGMLLLMGSKVAEKIAAGKRPWPELRQCRERCEKKFSSAAFPRSGLVVCWACSAVWRCKSSGQPDGGEGLVRCKGHRLEVGSERSMDQVCESMDKNRIQGVSAGRAGYLPRSPYPSRVRSVDSAIVHRSRRNLPQEICSVSLRRLRLSKGGLTAGQKSAEGIVGHDVGKASEALRMPKGGATDRPSRERWLKARTRGRGQ